ncbi:MAG: hypothetical protein H5T64_08845 [Chloroflexi bacterium]|nr:hypothetical protein [Chloroflexota bacterium]
MNLKTGKRLANVSWLSIDQKRKLAEISITTVPEFIALAHFDSRNLARYLGIKTRELRTLKKEATAEIPESQLSRILKAPKEEFVTGALPPTKADR